MSVIQTQTVQDKETHRRFIRIHGKLISKRFSRKTDADRWYVEKKREKELVESGMHSPVTLIPLAVYADRWMASRKAQGKPESSWKTDERRLRLHILPRMGSRMIQQIVRREWDEFLEKLVTDQNLHPKTRNRVQALLCKMYNDALRQEVVTANPLAMIPKLRETQDAWDYWHTEDECSRYLAASAEEGSVFQLFAALALNTGARVGELLALRYEDVQLHQRSIHIWRTYEQETRKVVERTKGKADRWLGINDALYETLVRQWAEPGSRSPEALLLSLEAGRPINEWMIRLRHRRTCDRAGVKRIRVHDLRHTYASHYVMRGGSVADLQGLLGHSSSMMTMKYAHLVPGHLKSKSNVVCFTAAPTEAALGNVVKLVRSRL